jgi:hypothetical protein
MIELYDLSRNPPDFVMFSLEKHEEWSKNMDYYDDPDLNRLEEARLNHVFLVRNRNHSLGKEEDWLDACYIENGLETRLFTATHKLFHVENTEDVLFRAGKVEAPERFEAQLASKHAPGQRLLAALEKLQQMKLQPNPNPNPVQNTMMDIVSNESQLENIAANEAVPSA